MKLATLPNPRLWLAGAALSAITIGAISMHSGTTAANVPPAAEQATPVSVATVQASAFTGWDEFSGRLEAVERVDLRSRVSGTVQSVHFREGALVQKGDLLISIDPAPYKAEMERAAAQLAAAQARTRYSKSERDRAQRLSDEGAIAQRELDERVNAQNEADANLRAAQAALQSARLNLDYTQVRAPVAGRVGRLEVTVGNLIAAGPGAPVLTTLVSVSPIYASYDADEGVVARALKQAGSSAQALESIPVQMGTAATDDTPYTGRLQLVDNQVDPRTGTVRVRAVFDNKDGSLMPGQFARIRMGQATADTALLITERAVGTDQSKKFVLVVNDSTSKAEYREVTLGAAVNGLRVVSSGLKAGERIVVNGLQRVHPGSLLATQAVEMEAKHETSSSATKS